MNRIGTVLRTVAGRTIVQASNKAVGWNVIIIFEFGVTK
jgi:hypothetical protein